MARLGIETGADLAAKERDWLIGQFGSWGDYLYLAARGIDDRPVRPDRIRKSIGAETTFFQDLRARPNWSRRSTASSRLSGRASRRRRRGADRDAEGQI